MTLSIFHAYGLILAVAAVLGWELIRRKAAADLQSRAQLTAVAPWVALGGVLGARLYHVFTDFALYRDDLLRIFFIWQGGLSIIGCVLGGAIGFFLFAHIHPNRSLHWQTLFDLSVFGLPFAQALGRVGNFVNQELYGLPSNLPWAIPIDPAHRLPGFSVITHFHPLFAYEALPLILFGCYVWWKNPQVGSGWLFFGYIAYYAILRFCLDFLRVDKVSFFATPLSINQVFFLVLFFCIAFFWIVNKRRYR